MDPERRQPYIAEGLLLEYPCPEDGTPMKATGKLFYDPKFDRWYAEFHCEREQDWYVLWAPETQAAAEMSAKTPL